MDEKPITAERVKKARSRWLRLSPDRFVVGLLAVECLLWLSDRFQWFGFNQHKGWTVLIAVAVVGVAAFVMLLWWLAGLIVGWRFQFGIRSLLVFCLAPSIAAGWLAVEIERARRQQEVVEGIQNSAGSVLYDWQINTDKHPSSNLESPAPAWLCKALGVDIFSTVDAITIGTQTTDAGLEHLKELTHLRVLNLNETKITDAGLAHLKGLSQLQWMGLFGTKITDAGLENLEGVSQLRVLDLSNTNTTDVGLEHLKDLTQLRELDLIDAKITDAGLEHLKELTQLRGLDLWGTAITDAGLEQLKQLTQLQVLNVSGTAITDAGLEQLTKLTQLQVLYVIGTKVTDAGVKKLQQALPNCKIRR